LLYKYYIEPDGLVKQYENHCESYGVVINKEEYSIEDYKDLRDYFQHKKENIQSLQNIRYNEFLQSPEYDFLCAKIEFLDNNKCIVTGDTDNLTVFRCQGSIGNLEVFDYVLISKDLVNGINTLEDRLPEECLEWIYKAQDKRDYDIFLLISNDFNKQKLINHYNNKIKKVTDFADYLTKRGAQ
jgi:hypothetical protein